VEDVAVTDAGTAICPSSSGANIRGVVSEASPNATRAVRKWLRLRACYTHVSSKTVAWQSWGDVDFASPSGGGRRGGSLGKCFFCVLGDLPQDPD
jgi:hypothetical protein